MSPPFLVTTISSGDTVPVGSPAQIPVLIICSALAAVGFVGAFTPGQDPRPVIGLGMGCDELLYALRDTDQICNVSVAAATWSAAPSFTHLDASGGGSPTGPAVTVALGAGVPGCLDDHQLVLSITTSGPLGTATGSLAYDGGDGVETFQLPTEGPATIIGTAPITPSVLALASALTLQFDQPAAKTLTLPRGSVVAAGAGLQGATATVAAPVTLAGASLLAAGVAALLANPRRLTFATAGATASDAPANVVITGTDYAGATITETLLLAQTAASATSVKAYATITTLVYPAADGTGATVAVGYADAYASVGELIAEVNTLATAAPLLAHAFDVQTAAGHFVGLSTTATGTGATITLDPATTSLTLFGFSSGPPSNMTATGTPATYALPNSGLVLTFPVGSYVYLESYIGGCVGPRASVSAIAAAVSAAVAAFATNPFGLVVVPQPADTAANCVTLAATLETIRAAALVATIPRDFYCIVGSPWHVASATPATNQANITSADAALLAAFSTAAANAGSVAVDDVYITGSALLAPGVFRRSSAICMAVKRASAPRVAATCAEGTVPEATLTAGDGLTLARDQNTAVTHLEGLDGPGFFPLKSADDSGAVKFAIGATRAGKTSRLRHDGDFAVCAETARLVQGIVKPWEAQRPGLDPQSGQMADHEKLSRAGQVDDGIRSFLLPDAGLPNCTDFGVAVTDPPTGLFQNNGITPTLVTIEVLGTITQVQIGISASGVTTITAPAGG